MRQYALKRYGKFVKNSVFDSRIQCWSAAYSIITGLYSENHAKIIPACKRAGYAVVQVEVTDRVPA